MRLRVATSDTSGLVTLASPPATVTHIVAATGQRPFCNVPHAGLVTVSLTELSKPEVLGAVELCEQCLFAAITASEPTADLAVTVLRRSVLQHDRR